MALLKKTVQAEPVVPTAFVPLGRLIRSDELHYRKINTEFVTELVNSITTSGLDTPLTTWGGGEEQVTVKVSGETGNAYYVVAGIHRQAALKKIAAENPKRFEALFPNGIPIVHRLGTAADMLAMQVRENCSRREMAPEDIFPVLKDMETVHGLKRIEIAKKVGKSPAWVTGMMAINEELPAEAQEEVLKGQLPLQGARKLAAEAKSARKAGAPLTPAAVAGKVATLKTKAAAAAATGKVRAEKRVSAKAFHQRYLKLPAISAGRKILLLENALAYLAGVEKTKLLPEWTVEEKKSKVKLAKKA